MPILETTDHTVPRSALRYRPTTADALPLAPLVKRASRQHLPDTDDEVVEWQHRETDEAPGDATTTTRRRRKVAALPPVTSTRHALRLPSVLSLSVGMLFTFALVVLLSIVVPWVQTTLDDLHYGRPRTFQLDAYVGHHETPGNPSHFVALNLKGRIEVIELPGGDPTRARIYLGPQLYGTGADLVPVTLSFQDVNGDHQPDMILHFQGNEVIFLNTGDGFRPAQPGEVPGSG